MAKFYFQGKWIVCSINYKTSFAEVDGIKFMIDVDGFIVIGNKFRARLYDIDYNGQP